MATSVPAKLAHLSHGSGCACKIGPAELESILAGLEPATDPALIVGAETRDDAAAYRLRADLALVHTVDFFTPIVDDPYDFGRIAAANALSDIYAMGAVPVSALNLVAFSLRDLGAEVLREILRGAADKAREAGVAVAGGHSIDDPEPKYGMAVAGTAHPDRLLRNSTARAGDVLVLTKPIGGGVVTTAAKRGIAPGEVVDRAIEVMATLNRDGAALALAAGASAMTDVTGFGLLGHLYEMAHASGLAAEMWADAVPLLGGALDLAADPENVPGGSRRNRAYLEPHVAFGGGVGEEARALLFDAMTSGGLLVAVSETAAPGLRRRLHEAGAPAAAAIGRLRKGEPGTIEVLERSPLHAPGQTA